jgi:tetratricopeptide (TPR) repeat protein
VILTALLALVGISAEGLWNPGTEEIFRASARLCEAGQYTGAAKTAQQLPTDERDLLLTVVALSRFEDLHEPAQLQLSRTRIEAMLERLQEDTPPQQFLKVLALVQASVIYAKTGDNFKAAMRSRKAAAMCQKLQDDGYHSPDLDGILGGYLFWKAQSLGMARSLLGGDTRTRGIRLTESAANSASPFRDAYRTSLVWIRFEQGKYGEALGICQKALGEMPNHHLWLQAKGDMLFRLGRLDEALDVYRKSHTDLAGVETLPVNLMSAAGNLGRIHYALGRADSARKWIQAFDAPAGKPSRPWLPASLVREIEPLRKKLSLPEP